MLLLTETWNLTSTSLVLTASPDSSICLTLCICFHCYRKLLHLANFYFVYVCFPIKPPERDRTWVQIRGYNHTNAKINSGEYLLQSFASEESLQLWISASRGVQLWWTLFGTDQKQKLKINTARPSFLGKCEVDRMNCSADTWITGRQKYLAFSIFKGFITN